MTRPMRFQVLQGMAGRHDERFDERFTAPQASYEMRRAAVLSYEELAAGPGLLRRVARPLTVMPVRRDRALEIAREISTEELARDPLAHPVAPARPQGAARPVYVTPPEFLEEEPIRLADEEATSQNPEPVVQKTAVPVVEPVEPSTEARHGGGEAPERSRLSPSQRAALKRPQKRLDRDGKPTFVTYTVDTAKK